MDWQVIRIEDGCDGCIYAASVLPGWYDSAEDAEKSIPDNWMGHPYYSYHVAKRICGGIDPHGGLIEYNG